MDSHILTPRHAVLDGIDYVIRRSQRARRVRITVGSTGVLLVIPERVSQARAQAFLISQLDWVRRRLADWSSRPSASKSPVNQLSYLGQLHSVRVESSISRSGRAFVHLSPGMILVRVPEGSLELAVRALERWMRDQASRYFAGAVPRWCSLMEVVPGPITIRSQKSRWGSCTSRGALSFNWRALLTPPDTVDYLVIHECAHLRHLNHGPRFWGMVERFCPDFRRHRDFLRASSRLLDPDWIRLAAPASASICTTSGIDSTDFT
jgi:predicted metal-dependent hydrolase